MRGPEDSEYYEEWLDRDEDERSISFDDYEEMRSAEDYGSDYSIDDDDDSYDW